MADVPFEASRDAANHSAEALNELFEERRDWRRFTSHPELGFQNSYQLITRRDTAERLKIATGAGQATISDLAKICPSDSPEKNAPPCPLRFKSSPDFFYRADGVHGLREKYKFEFRSIDYTLHENIYGELKKKSAEVVDGWATDPELRLDKHPLFIKLSHDKKFFPPYYAVGLANRKLFEAFPGVHKSLAGPHRKISEKDISDLIGKVGAAKIASEELGSPQKAQALEAIIKEFLTEKRILDKGGPRPTSQLR